MKQLNIFELTKPKYKITKPIRLVENFAGIGSQAKALKNIGANFEHHRAIEYDKYAMDSYNAIHGTNFEPLDITKITAKDLGIVETDKYDYIMTYSFPCQDLSQAGKGAGMKKGSGTRSGLLWEVERLLNECKELPQILLMENVPQVIGEKNIQDFHKWQLFLEKLGYSSYFKLLNAKNYEIPQNRNRCFMVSILGDYYYEFPHKRKLKLRLKDMLEDEVDEKYYLDIKIYLKMKHDNKINDDNKIPIDYIIMPKENTYILRAARETIEKTIVADGTIPKVMNLFDRRPVNDVSPTLCTSCGSASACSSIVINEINEINNFEIHRQTLEQYIEYGNIINAFRGKVNESGCNPTITAPPTHVLRIRESTPRECWRLMGFTDEDFEKARKVNSDAQLYKQAGNSIVVKVLERIFEEFILT